MGFRKISLFLLRVSIGWMFLYAGITKVLDPTWTSAGYLNNAKTFVSFYQWLASPGIVVWVDLINQWGLALLGISLIVGIFVRYSALLGVLLMALYYIPVLSFPYVGTHSFLIDEHVIYIFALLVLRFSDTGRS
ncbi:MAG: DoxX family protein [Parcubacteria group bacterium]|nr:DoxX family protein [Parcubacteria group bacterium]